MTVIEKQYMNSVININRMMRKAQDAQPDWEERRYEIAKETAASIFGALTAGAIRKEGMFDPDYEWIAETSANMANALIEEMKRTQEKK